MKADVAAQADRRLALSQSMLDNISMAADLDMVCESGTHALGLYRPMVEAAGATETVRLLRERGLGVSSIHLGLKVMEWDDEQADHALRQGLRLAAAVGAPVAPVSPGSRGSLSALLADEIYIRRLSRVAPLARELGVTMTIEPVHPFLHGVGYIHTIRHAARIAERVENCGIIVDVAHIYWDGDLEEDIPRHCDKIALVQIANLDPQALAARRWGRALLDQGAVPIADIVHWIDAAGYRGAYESEILLELPHDECIAAARSSRLWFETIWDGRR
jgi:sugar phosphate isomerase/epimerase